ncbi:MAG: Ca-activated chloride channel [Candidatus Cloacimonadota bacterium]|nr:Ca-activated chloride channel [Candidatus Cloacimonadota bacterium]
MIMKMLGGTMTRKILMMMLLGGIAILFAASTGRLKVKVYDNYGKPLEFVNVVVLQDSLRITGGQTNKEGIAMIVNLPPGTYDVRFSLVGYETKTITDVNIRKEQTSNLSQVLVQVGVKTGAVVVSESLGDNQMRQMGMGSSMGNSVLGGMAIFDSGSYLPPDWNTEDYSAITPNIFHSPLTSPLSTFSIDVDTATYSNIRRMLNQGYLPSPNTVRTEEILNYFSYDYPQPRGEHPFSVYTEMGVCPWNPKRNLVHIGLQGKKLDMGKAPANNLVFLLDVSGSMNSPNKLPLVQRSMKLLLEKMRPEDKIAIVVYAGAAGLVLPSTYGEEKPKIAAAIDNLQAGGSTAGGAGIQLAYNTAVENFIEGGNNRIILCTDGDFNIGVSSDADMTKLIEGNRDKGVFLTVLGFGMGNYKDNRLELLADKGNGNYAYIDDISEARKVLVNEMGATLFTIAKDVKIQVEFNPAHVKAYRLIGYENRLLQDEDFSDDTKDAGEMGAGHTVTAVYEIIPANSKEEVPGLEPLKYQEIKINDEARNSPEIMNVKLRYKLPTKDESILMETPVYNKALGLEDVSETFLFSSAVVGYSMLLQEYEDRGSLTWERVLSLASENMGEDAEGYRHEFIQLVTKAAQLMQGNSPD